MNANVKNLAYLSLGANLGDRTANLRAAIMGLSRIGEIAATSSFYETEPVDVAQAQPWFLNCAVGIVTELAPLRLLAGAMSLELALGRHREERRSPRTLDVDILLFGDAVMQTPELTIPHPEMHRRRFVLEPLAEIAPQARHPILKVSVAELLKELPPGGRVRRYQER
jgi:2-amino-4-hydroxy-6-hydroxymethyldihydropteridine diphosphokinase